MGLKAKITNLDQKSANIVVAAAIALYVLVFSLISFWKYFNFGDNALDLAIINQAFYNSSLGNFFVSSIHPPSYLGDHFEPILLLLLPIYLIFKNPSTLLILQSLALGICAWPIYLISRQVFKNFNLAILVSLAWLFNPLVENINLFEFHLLPFALPGLFFAWYYFIRKKLGRFLLFSVLALLVREDVALVILMFGFLSFIVRPQLPTNNIENKKKNLLFKILPLILGVSYFILALKINSLFAQNGQYKFFIYYNWLGQNWPEFIKNLFLRPDLVILHLWRLGNLEFILGLLLPLAFLPLLALPYLLPGILIMAQLLLGSAGGSATLLQIHYPTLLLPALFISAIYALAKIFEPAETKNRLLKFFQREKILAILILVLAVIYSNLTLGPLTGAANQLTHKGIIWPQTQTKLAMTKQIPPTAAVATTYDFLANLSSRSNIYSFNYIFLGRQQFLSQDYLLPADTQYLLLDYQDLITYQLQYGQNSFYQKQYQWAIINWQRNLKDFGLVDINDTVALYQKGEKNRFTLVEILDSLTEQPKLNYSFDQKIKLLDVKKIDQGWQFFWQAKSSLEKNYELNVTLEKNDKIFYQQIYSLGYGLLPTSLWLNNKVVQTNYWFDFTKKVPAGTYDLKIQPVEIIAGGIEVNNIRSTQNVIDKKIFLGEKFKVGEITI